MCSDTTINSKNRLTWPTKIWPKMFDMINNQSYQANFIIRQFCKDIKEWYYMFWVLWEPGSWIRKQYDFSRVNIKKLKNS